MAPQTKLEISVASSSTGNDDMPIQTKRRGSLKTVTSWANPWNEPLPMNAIPQRRSLPDQLDGSDTNHSKRDTVRASYHTASPASAFPSVKRTGWFSFITASFRHSTNRQHLLSFESLTKIRCFGEILIRLSDDSINKAQWLKCRGYESPLHLLLQYRPPLTVVNTIIFELKVLGQECPESICDLKGRNSLHIACATVPSNSVAVIARLLNGLTIHSTVNPAAVLDKQKMLPLHHACTGKVSKSDLKSRLLIIRFLTECFPQGVLMQNNRGMTPSDLVRKSGNNPEILMILYQAIIDQRKAAAANSVKNKSIAICSSNTLNNDLVQKYTKSEHRRDGLAAFVQSSTGSPLTNVNKHRLSYDIQKDEISDFESMDTFGCIDSVSQGTTNDANLSDSMSDAHKEITQLPSKEQIDIHALDEFSEMDSVYTSGFSVDDSSALVHEVQGISSQDKVKESSEMLNGIAETEEASTETSENCDDSVVEHFLYLDEPVTVPTNNVVHEGTLCAVDDSLDYSNSETGHELEMMEANEGTTYSLSKYFDAVKSDPLLSEVDTSSVSLSSGTVNTPSTRDTTGTTSIDSPSTKKMVQFNDCVQIFKLTDYYPSKESLMDYTDPTESETSTSSSSNPLDDSDRGGSVTMISEVVTTTVTTKSSSLLMQRYGRCGGAMAAQTTNKIHKEKGLRSTIDATNLYFL